MEPIQLWGFSMSEEIKNVPSRRSAIKTAAQVAVTAPAVGLLLSAGTKSAKANVSYEGDDFQTQDDNLVQNGGFESDAILGDDAVTF
jgi:hypothetical protein